MDNFSENDSTRNAISEEFIIKEEEVKEEFPFYDYGTCKEEEEEEISCEFQVDDNIAAYPLSIANIEATAPSSSRRKQKLQDCDHLNSLSASTFVPELQNCPDYVNTSAPLFICGLCQESFVEESELTSHLSRNHRHRHGKKREHKNSEEIPDKELFPYACNADNCSKRFVQSLELLEHIQHDHKPNHFPLLHICKICKAQFSTPVMLGEHLSTHKREKSYLCAYCNQKFWKTSDLIEHISIHNLPKPETRTEHLTQVLLVQTLENSHSCRQCKMEFATMNEMKTHLSIHSKKIPTCQQCKMEFTSMKEMNAHLSIHTKEMLTCQQCKISFVWVKDLNEHLLAHKGEKFPTCHHCGKQYVRMGDLIDHLTIHGPPKCEHCGKTCETQSILETHLLTHHGKQTSFFVCEHCKLFFATQSFLDKHSCANIKNV